MENYYIERISAIVKLANERSVDMSTALAIYINEIGDKAPASCEQSAEQAFFEFIKDKRFDTEGNEIV